MRLTIFQMQVSTTETPRITRKRKDSSCDRENGNEEESGSSAAAWSSVIAAAASPSGPKQLQLESRVAVWPPLDASHLYRKVRLVVDTSNAKFCYSCSTVWGRNLFRGFCNIFSESFACLGSMTAAIQPSNGLGTLRKFITKPSEQVAAPD